MSLLDVGIVRLLMELSNALRSEQYAGLLLPPPQPAIATRARAATNAVDTRREWPRTDTPQSCTDRQPRESRQRGDRAFIRSGRDAGTPRRQHSGHDG